MLTFALCMVVACVGTGAIAGYVIGHTVGYDQGWDARARDARHKVADQELHRIAIFAKDR